MVQRGIGAQRGVARRPWESTAIPPSSPQSARRSIGIRRAKTEAKASQKTAVARVTIAAPAASMAALRLAEGDLKAVGRIGEITYADAEATAVTAIELTPQEA